MALTPGILPLRLYSGVFILGPFILTLGAFTFKFADLVPGITPDNSYSEEFNPFTLILAEGVLILISLSGLFNSKSFKLILIFSDWGICMVGVGISPSIFPLNFIFLALFPYCPGVEPFPSTLTE